MSNKMASLALMFIVICGCSSPQDATELNFLKAIAVYQDQQNACFNAWGNFPLEIAKNDRTFEKKSTILNELVNVGLLKTEDVQVKQTGFISPGASQMTDGLRYSATERAEPFLVASDRPLFRSAMVCYGNYKAVAVKSYTEPADMMGQKISRVIYTYKLNNVAPWAKDSAILHEQIPSLARDISSLSTPIEGEALLVLTNKGWVHEKMFRAGI